MVATTSITPKPVSPLVKFANASSPRLKPKPEVSMPVNWIVRPVCGLDTFQQEPQLVEFHTMSNAPPMNVNEGRSPNVGYFAMRPLSPSEHATVFIEPLRSSNMGSNVARKGEGMGWLGCGALGGTEDGVVGVDSVGLAEGLEANGPVKVGIEEPGGATEFEELGGVTEDTGGVEATEDVTGVGDTDGGL